LHKKQRQVLLKQCSSSQFVLDLYLFVLQGKISKKTSTHQRIDVFFLRY